VPDPEIFWPRTAPGQNALTAKTGVANINASAHIGRYRRSEHRISLNICCMFISACEPVSMFIFLKPRDRKYNVYMVFGGELLIYFRQRTIVCVKQIRVRVMELVIGSVVSCHSDVSAISFKEIIDYR